MLTRVDDAWAAGVVDVLSFELGVSSDRLLKINETLRHRGFLDGALAPLARAVPTSCIGGVAQDDQQQQRFIDIASMPCEQRLGVAFAGGFCSSQSFASAYCPFAKTIPNAAQKV